MWENLSPLKQLSKIGEKLAQSLASGGITDFESLEKANPRHIEMV